MVMHSASNGFFLGLVLGLELEPTPSGIIPEKLSWDGEDGVWFSLGFLLIAIGEALMEEEKVLDDVGVVTRPGFLLMAIGEA